jgi:hypothetical protein
MRNSITATERYSCVRGSIRRLGDDSDDAEPRREVDEFWNGIGTDVGNCDEVAAGDGMRGLGEEGAREGLVIVGSRNEKKL